MDANDAPPIRPTPCDSASCRLLEVLFGVLLIGMLAGAAPLPNGSTPDGYSPAETDRPRFERVERGLAPPQEPVPSSDDESFVEQVLEVLLGAILLTPVLALLFAFPATLLGVSLVMDGGCLRYLLFGLGWICAIFYGMLLGAVVGDALLGLEFLVQPIGYTFMWGYPVAAWWAHKKLESMPRERYRAWDQTLTGGALLGFGVGSVANLLRSAFTVKGGGFGGFGGGSFGGGGASGSWSGASGAAGSVSSGASVNASTTTGGTTASAVGSSAAATAGATGASSVEGAEPSALPADASQARGFWERLRRWFQKFQWYHGVIFVLVTLVFVPLGLGTMQALKNTTFLVIVLVCAVVYGGYRFLRHNPHRTRAVVRSISSFKGGEASSSWS